MNERIRSIAIPTITAVAFFVLWELVCRIFNIKSFILPTPSAAIASLFPVAPTVMGHALQTLYTTMVGFGLAVAAGVFLGAAGGALQTASNVPFSLLGGFHNEA